MFDRLYKQIDSSLDWLYQRAKRYKPISFLVSGVSIAISTGTSLISPTAAWISNLAAVLGGSLYSILKNFETAESIAEQQRATSLIVESLSLEKYPEKHESHSLEETLRQVTALDETEIQNFKARLGKDAIGSSRRYANYNLLAQVSFSFVLTIINIIANTATTEEKENPANAKNVVNTITVLLCVLSQYLIHSGYAASGLRRLATEVTERHTNLSNIHEGLLFRVRERDAFFKSRQHIEMELMKLSDEIAAIEQCNANLEKQREEKKEKCRILYQTYTQLKLQFPELDLRQYLIIENQAELKAKLEAINPKIVNLNACIEYINVTRDYSRLMVDVDTDKKKIDKNIEKLEQKEKEFVQLQQRYQNLSMEKNKFQQIDTEIVKLKRLLPI